MKIKWSREALSNLTQIEDYIAEDNSVAANNLVDKIIFLGEDLKNFPNKGRIVPELSLEQIREILHKNYRIVYLDNKNSIEILTVFEGHKLLYVEYLR